MRLRLLVVLSLALTASVAQAKGRPKCVDLAAQVQSLGKKEAAIKLLGRPTGSSGRSTIIFERACKHEDTLQIEDLYVRSGDFGNIEKVFY